MKIRDAKDVLMRIANHGGGHGYISFGHARRLTRKAPVRAVFVFPAGEVVQGCMVDELPPDRLALLVEDGCVILRPLPAIDPDRVMFRQLRDAAPNVDVAIKGYGGCSTHFTFARYPITDGRTFPRQRGNA